ncbi:MAG: hypothetical protein ACK5IJ_11070 [Mangrovibacterium sp.]
MKQIHFFTYILLAVVLSMSACKKDEFDADPKVDMNFNSDYSFIKNGIELSISLDYDLEEGCELTFERIYFEKVNSALIDNGGTGLALNEFY